jgi:glucose/arabinose dehydrogenase
MISLRLAFSALSAAAFAVPAVAEQTNAPQAEKTAVKTEIVARGLANPWGLQFLPDGRYLVTEKPGRLRIVGKDGKISEPIAGVPEVAAQGQGGLLDVALAPDFAESGKLFFAFSEPRGGEKNGTSVARAKLVLDGDGGRLEDVTVIFRQEPAFKSSFHFGSRIVINPDGTLFVTTGERNFLRAEAQNPANHIGKVIRITADGAPAPDNPKREGWDAKVWSIGHRNIQGAILDPATGKLWTVEHGARGGDEINHPEAGKNYGWPIITYGIDYSGAKIGEGTSKAGMEQPVYYWDPSIAVSGLTFYTGDLFPKWKGNLLVGSLKGTHMQRLVMKDGEVVAHERLLSDLDERIRDVRQGPDGAVYVLTDELKGALVRVTPAS